MSDNKRGREFFDDDRLLAALEGCREEYRNFEVPAELDFVVRDAVSSGGAAARAQRAKRRAVMRAVKYAGRAAAILFAGMVLFLNISPVFAQTAYGLPFIGNFCRIFTFRSYEFADEIKYIDAEIPAIADTGNSELEKRVNLEIMKIMNRELMESEAHAQEYYDAFVETGGNPDDFIPIGITVDYEIKLLSEHYTSFVISKYETRSSAYYTRLYYNIDIESGRVLTLRDCLGNDYKQIAAQGIRETIAGWTDKERALLWDNLDFEDLITEQTDFYLDTDGFVTVVFHKYEIAAGVAGELEFTIAKSL